MPLRARLGFGCPGDLVGEGALRGPGTGSWEGGSGGCMAGQARGHPWGGLTSQAIPAAATAPASVNPDLVWGLGTVGSGRGTGLEEGSLIDGPGTRAQLCLGAVSGWLLKPDRVFREVSSLVRAGKTRKVIGGAGKKEHLARRLWSPATTGPRPSLIVPAPLRPATLAPAPGPTDGTAAFQDRRPWVAPLCSPSSSEHSSEGTHSPCSLPLVTLWLYSSHILGAFRAG